MIKDPARNRLQLGLSMIEMMFAMVVLFLVGAFVMNMFVTGSHQLVRAGKKEKLSGLLRAKSSQLRLEEYSLLASIPKNGTFSAPNTDFRYELTFSDFNGLPQTEARIINVAVEHTDIGRMETRLVRSNVPPDDPGKVAFDKFGCASCHSLVAAGYAAGPGLVALDQIGTTGLPRPYQTGSGTFDDYLLDSLMNPAAFDAYPADPLTMTDFIIEGEPGYDSSTDVSAQELSDLTTWIGGFYPP